jgi:2-dehydropantoate 2-reductase
MNHIAIIGAGAIGSVLGGLLSRAGYAVTLIGHADQVQAIVNNGLKVDGSAGSFVVRVAASEKLDFQPDLVLLAVKAQDVLSAVRNNLAFISAVPLVTLQNGVRSDEMLATMIPPQNLMSVVVMINASYLEPGKVTLAYPGGLIIGRPFGKKDIQLEQVAQILNQVVPTRVSNNVKGAHWLKLIVNLNNALPALTNFSMSQVYSDPYLRTLAIRLMREGLFIVKQAGIKLESLPDVTIALTRLMTLIPVSIAARLIAAKARRLETKWPILSSTLQSIRRNRSTEIDYLNGEIVKLGKQLGLSTPLNAKIVELVHQVEQTRNFFSVSAICKQYSNYNFH